MCILSVFTLLKVVGYYYDVLSMSVMGFQKKFRGGWGELYPIFFWIFVIFVLLCKASYQASTSTNYILVVLKFLGFVKINFKLKNTTRYVL